MRFLKVNSTRHINVNIQKFLIDWEGKCRSKFQLEVKQWLKTYWKSHICLEEFTVPGSRMKCDIVNMTRRIIVEVSGDQHVAFNKHFHFNSREVYLNQIKRDVAKAKWAEDNGFKFVEIFPEDLPLTKKFFQEKYQVEL